MIPSGHFVWGGRDFTTSARDISISSGRGQQPVLHANLRDPSGKFVRDSIDLSEHIGNIEGELIFRP